MATSSSDTVRLRATIVVEYDAHPDDYVQDGGTITPEEMAQMDADQCPPEDFLCLDTVSIETEVEVAGA